MVGVQEFAVIALILLAIFIARTILADSREERLGRADFQHWLTRRPPTRQRIRRIRALCKDAVS
jgi:hypothetical protein